MNYSCRFSFVSSDSWNNLILKLKLPSSISYSEKVSAGRPETPQEFKIWTSSGSPEQLITYTDGVWESYFNLNQFLSCTRESIIDHVIDFNQEKLVAASDLIR